VVAVTEKPVSMDVGIDPTMSRDLVHVWKSDKDEQLIETQSVKPVHGAFSVESPQLSDLDENGLIAWNGELETFPDQLANVQA